MIIRYYAWLREKLARSEDDVSPPKQVVTVADLLAWLGQRDSVLGEAVKDLRALRVALDDKIVPFTTNLGAASVVALFPPMTGG